MTYRTLPVASLVLVSSIIILPRMIALPESSLRGHARCHGHDDFATGLERLTGASMRDNNLFVIEVRATKDTIRARRATIGILCDTVEGYQRIIQEVFWGCTIKVAIRAAMRDATRDTLRVTVIYCQGARDIIYFFLMLLFILPEWIEPASHSSSRSFPGSCMSSLSLLWWWGW